MNPIDTEVDIKGVAVYLLLDFLLLLSYLYILLATTLARSYSFNPSSSVSVWADDVLPLSSVSSTRALTTGYIFFTWE